MINFISKPILQMSGETDVPGDKSISHRAIIFGAIATGTTVINGFLNGEDCLATLAAFRSMGIQIEGPDEKGQVVIQGRGKYGLAAPTSVIDCGNSGTSMRLLTGLLAAQKFDTVLTGDESLLKRPMERISYPLNLMGADVGTSDGKPPIRITGNQLLKGIEYTMPMASAQVKSCLLLAGLYAQGETTVIEPGLTRDHTERMLTAFSYPIKKCGDRITVSGENECSSTEINVPGDISSAAFFIVAATLVPGSDIRINNVGINPTRIGILEILQLMGAKITLENKRLSGEEPVADIHVCHAPLEGIDIPPELVPLAIDEFPVIFIAAACAKGKTRLHGASELRSKESDRIGTMVEGLTQLGIDTQGFEDGILITGGTLTGGEVNSYKDHRIAMAFAIAGAVAQQQVVIKDCKNVATSFPDFVSIGCKLNLNIEVVDAK